jgi:hypothetical protein
MTGSASKNSLELITLPVMLISLLRFSDIGVQTHRARGGSGAWYFRFTPGNLLEVGDDGHWMWRRGSERWRRRIAPFLVRAEVMLREPRLNISPFHRFGRT